MIDHMMMMSPGRLPDPDNGHGSAQQSHVDDLQSSKLRAGVYRVTSYVGLLCTWMAPWLQLVLCSCALANVAEVGWTGADWYV